MREIITNSAAETEEAGKWLAEFVRDGDIIAYRGGLGMGKTTFTRGLAAGLGIEADVSSPTFTLINEYRGENKNLCHVDAYRLHGVDDLVDTGFYDYVDAGLVLLRFNNNISRGLSFNTFTVFSDIVCTLRNAVKVGDCLKHMEFCFVHSLFLI
jgi:tRNA threonylcarbamoyladenosine biosynthesis protein TsaE